MLLFSLRVRCCALLALASAAAVDEAQEKQNKIMRRSVEINQGGSIAEADEAHVVDLGQVAHTDASALETGLKMRAGLGEEVSLEEAEMAMHALDLMMASHIEEFSSDGQNIGLFFGKAADAVRYALQHFMQDPLPAIKVVEGIGELGKRLFECLELLIKDSLLKDEEGNTHEWWTRLKAGWDELFETLPVVQNEIEDDIKEFAENGKPEKLARVISTCVSSAIAVVEDFMPQQTFNGIEKYLEGIKDVIQGVADAWEAAAAGEKEVAVVAVYDGLRGAIDAVLPPSFKDDSTKAGEIVGTVLGVVDHQMNTLVSKVQLYKRKLQESQVCYRKTIRRAPKTPMDCSHHVPNVPTPWFADGEGNCMKDGYKPSPASLSEVDRSNVTALIHKATFYAKRELISKRGGIDSMDRALLFKKGKETWKPRPALCPDGYTEKIGNRCYKADPDAGFANNGKNLIAKCPDGKSFGSGSDGYGGMCGKTPQMITMVTIEMAMAVVKVIVAAVSTIVEALEKEKVGVGSLNTLIDTLVEAGAAFAIPKCAVEGAPAASALALEDVEE